jgi:hypothetical protein
MKDKFNSYLSEGFQFLAHHMTINLGDSSNGPAKDLVGKEFKIIFTDIAQNDKVIAAKVICDCPSVNEIKHVTIAVNRENGGKPFQSNLLTNWLGIKPFEVSGKVKECV